MCLCQVEKIANLVVNNRAGGGQIPQIRKNNFFIIGASDMGL